MAGIFSLRHTDGIDDLKSTSEKLGEKMCIFPWQSYSLLEFPEAGVILGAVVNNNPSQSAQGFWHREGNLGCVVENPMVRTLEDCGATAHIQAGEFARAAMAAYRKFGDTFVTRIEGPFSLVLFDADCQKLIAGNGRIGASMLYNYRCDDRLIYGSQLGPLAACGFFSPETDDRAISVLLGHGQVYGKDTILKDVVAFEPGTMEINDLASGRSRKENYWFFGSQAGHDHSLSYKQHLNKICDIILAAGERMTARQGRYVAGLSGGLDSRLVLGIAHRFQPDLKAWTFGSPEAPDMVTAGTICRDLGLDHLTFTTKPELIPENSSLYSATVDGLISCDFAYGLERTHALRDSADIVLNGFMGEVVLGDYMVGPRAKIMATNLMKGKVLGRRQVGSRLRENTSISSMVDFLVHRKGGTSPLSNILTVPTPSLHQAYTEMLTNLKETIPLPYLIEHFMVSQRVSRWTIMGIVSDRHFYGDGSLFYDYDLIEAAMQVPYKYRENNKIYGASFKALTPDLASYPNVNSGMRADASAGAIMRNKFSRMILRKLQGKTPSTQVTGNDPNAWSRIIFPEYYKELLNDERTLSRSFWKGHELPGILKSHLMGQISVGGALGQLASVEHFCRRWLD